jgi:RNA polymerase sigma-70 factor (ECF subfamily)
MDDGSVVAAVLGGDERAFSVFVDRYTGPLLRLAESRLGRRAWAEEAVQETFLCAFKSLHRYDSRYSFRTWLWTILLNQCRRHYQRHMRRPRVRNWSDRADTVVAEGPPSGLASNDATPDARLLAEERARQLEELLRQLPATQADALRLRFFGDLKFQEIADTMQCSLSAAKQRVRLGLQRMSTLLRPRGKTDNRQSVV